MGASVKVMRSFDYCHFEICKSTDENLTNEQIDELRKDCQRLADKAVRQYQIAKNATAASIANRTGEHDRLKREVERILLKEEGDRTPDEQAKVKLLSDRDWQAYIDQRYDYEDEWDDHEDEG